MRSAAMDLLRFCGQSTFSTVLADPPWQFTNKTGKVAPEHKRLARYGTMKLDEIRGIAGFGPVRCNSPSLSVVP